MRPTLADFSKASRLPLTSKKANKNYYKGTRTGNILKMNRVAYMHGDGTPQLDQYGRQRTWTKRAGTRIDESRLNSYVVPPGLADTHLKPYVFARTGSPDKANMAGVPSSVSGYAAGNDLTKRSNLFAGGKGFRPDAYKELRQQILSRREQHEEATRESRRPT